MIDPATFIASLEKLDIRFVSGVPDSLLKDVCACISSHFPPSQHVIATNEGSAVALATGHYLATSRPALVYLQNAGLGNVINPITSLADSQVYGIPMVLMIGWRGEILDDGSQLKDEPQHVKQGQITLSQLELLGIPFRVIDNQTDDTEPILQELVDLALSSLGPVALVVRKQSFVPYKQPECEGNNLMLREEAIRILIAALPDDTPVISTTGMASRELAEYREASGEGHEKDFLTVGGMGHASQIAAGIAMAKPNRRIACVDGDGAILMHMGALAINADCPNLLHIVINNGAHDSVGGQPTKGGDLDFTEIAQACGYANIFSADTEATISDHIQSMLKANGSSFLEIKCRKGFRSELGRPKLSPADTKKSFMKFIQDSKS